MKSRGGRSVSYCTVDIMYQASTFVSPISQCFGGCGLTDRVILPPARMLVFEGPLLKSAFYFPPSLPLLEHFLYLIKQPESVQIPEKFSLQLQPSFEAIVFEHRASRWLAAPYS